MPKTVFVKMLCMKCAVAWEINSDFQPSQYPDIPVLFRSFNHEHWHERGDLRAVWMSETAPAEMQRLVKEAMLQLGGTQVNPEPQNPKDKVKLRLVH